MNPGLEAFTSQAFRTPFLVVQFVGINTVRFPEEVFISDWIEETSALPAFRIVQSTRDKR